jgi:hypothetical protein
MIQILWKNDNHPDMIWKGESNLYTDLQLACISTNWKTLLLILLMMNMEATTIVKPPINIPDQIITV